MAKQAKKAAQAAKKAERLAKKAAKNAEMGITEGMENLSTSTCGLFATALAVVGGCVFGMNMLALAEAGDFDRSIQILIDRALDIGRGGNGHVADLVLEKGAV